MYISINKMYISYNREKKYQNKYITILGSKIKEEDDFMATFGVKESPISCSSVAS